MMHEDFLSYIMLGLSRGLTPPRPQLRKFDDEERVMRALAAPESARRSAAVPVARQDSAGRWTHWAQRHLRAIGVLRLPRQARPSACR